MSRPIVTCAVVCCCAVPKGESSQDSSSMIGQGLFILDMATLLTPFEFHRVRKCIGYKWGSLALFTAVQICK